MSTVRFQRQSKAKIYGSLIPRTECIKRSECGATAINNGTSVYKIYNKDVINMEFRFIFRTGKYKR